MIIGSNNNQNNMSNNFTSNFNERFNAVQENNKKIFGADMGETTRNMKYTDVNSANEMQDKAFAMLQDRYRNGTISLDEFNKQCRALGKLRNK